MALVLLFVTSNKTVITVDGVEYSEKDFNIYAYLAKMDYLGTYEVSENDLKAQVSGSNNVTVAEFLKDATLNRIKTNGAVNRLANQYSIELEDSDYEELKSDKENVINALGGYNNFKKFLKEIHSDEESYDRALLMSALSDKVYSLVYSEGQLNDLTSEELSYYKKAYYSEYVKIYQIILLKSDIETGKGYTPEKILEKQNFAEELLKKIKNSSKEPFKNFVKNYSDSYKEDSNDNPEYYSINSLDSSIKEGVLGIKEGEVSSVISTQDAFHIIKREVLDDGMLDIYLEDKRQNKYVIDINTYLDELKIVNSDYLEKVTIK